MAEDPVKKHHFLAIGGSAGSLDVVLKIISALPATLSSTIVIILHRKATHDSILEQLITSKTTVPVKEIEDKEPLLPATIFIAPADYHLLIENETSFSLDCSEKVQFSRPSIDVTFSSIADCFGAAVIGILLSGANADGAEGLSAIKAAGGYTMVQDPACADVGYMPQQAIDLGVADEVLDVEALIASIIARLQ